MNYFPLSGLINAIVATVCGLVIFFNNRTERRNRIYALFCLSFAFWSFSYCAWQLSRGESTALFFARALMMGAIFIPVFTYHYTLVLLALGTPKRTMVLKISYVLTFIYILSNFTPLFISHVEKRLFFPHWPVPGPIFHPFLATFFILVVLSLRLVLEYKAKASPIVRNKLNWTATALFLGFFGGSTNFPLWYNIPLPPYLNLGASILPLVGALLFFRLGLLDFKLFLKNTVVHLLASIVIGGLYCILLYPFVPNWWVFLSIGLFAVVFPFVYHPLSMRVRDLISRTDLGRVDRYLGSSEKEINVIRESTYTYDDLAKNIVEAVRNTFPVEMVSVYFHDQPRHEMELRAQVGMKNIKAENLKYNRPFFAISNNNPLISLMIHQVKPVVLEEKKIKTNLTEKEKMVISTMEKMEGEVCSPFLISGSVKGLLVLGRKKNNEMFHKEDLETLDSFGRMGQEVMRYIMGMEYEINYGALYSHDMCNDTKSLAQTLQFLRSPLGKQTQAEKANELLKRAEDVASRLNQSFQLNRDRSALILKSIRGEYEREPVDMSQLVRESFGKFILDSEKRGIHLIQGALPNSMMVHGNANDLVRVLDNLLSNALRYVNKGGKISVEGKPNKNQFMVTVEDDGEGINKEDVERIWQHGWQVKSAKQGASGFGLAIARQIVHLHGGEIWVENRNDSHGAKFSFTIPMMNKNVNGK